MVLSFFIVVFLVKFSPCQSLMHSFGGNFSLMTTELKNSDGSRNSTFSMTVAHLSYFPRFNFIENDNSSISIGLPIGAGVNLVKDLYSGSGISWGFDLPVVLDYNMGLKSTQENESSFGGYLGVGFGYMYTSYSISGDVDKVISYGPIFRGGIRLSTGEGRWNNTVGLYFKPGLESQKFKTFGLNFLVDL